jgi:small-conductance mechanosensitive channel
LGEVSWRLPGDEESARPPDASSGPTVKEISVDGFIDALNEGVATIARVLPKALLFLAILIIGFIVAKAISKAVNAVLARVGFDKAVERGGVRKALAKSRFDASDLLAKLVYYAVMLLVLVLAFGVFGQNPISELLQGLIAYLPNLFVAILIIVIAAAVAAAVKELIDAALGGEGLGKTLGFAASAAILVFGGFAALNQLQIAPAIVNGLFYAILASFVGVTIVAVGGSGISALRPYWQQTLEKIEQDGQQLQVDPDVAKQRVQDRAEQRKEQARQQAPSNQETRSGRPPTTGGATQR